MINRRILASVAAATVSVSAGAASCSDFHTDIQLKIIEIRSSVATDPAPGSKAAIYPSEARKAGIDGQVTLGCQIQPQARFGNCRVLEEEPKGAGFADVALAIAPHIQQPVSAGSGGMATDGRAVIPFRFILEENEKRVISDKVVWDRQPTSEEGTAAYPFIAGYDGFQGTVVLECRPAADGSLTGCRTLYESPYGWGFKEAAISLAPRYRARMTLKDGSPLPEAGVVRIPMIFVNPTSPRYQRPVTGSGAKK
jgi:hypothetical protein